VIVVHHLRRPDYGLGILDRVIPVHPKLHRLELTRHELFYSLAVGELDAHYFVIPVVDTAIAGDSVKKTRVVYVVPDDPFLFAHTSILKDSYLAFSADG
jgi:hypothetical protein